MPRLYPRGRELGYAFRSGGRWVRCITGGGVATVEQRMLLFQLALYQNLDNADSGRRDAGNESGLRATSARMTDSSHAQTVRRPITGISFGTWTRISLASCRRSPLVSDIRIPHNDRPGFAPPARWSKPGRVLGGFQGSTPPQRQAGAVLQQGQVRLKIGVAVSLPDQDAASFGQS